MTTPFDSMIERMKQSGKEYEAGYNHSNPEITELDLWHKFFTLPDGIEKDNIKYWLQLEVLK